MKGFVAATTFLTRVGAGAQLHKPGDITVGVPWFPIVGALVGVVVAGVYAGAQWILPSFVSAVVAVAFGVWITGAFHEDGLADTADALGGMAAPDHARRILKDPTLGTYGVCALVFSLLVRVGLVASFDVRTAFVLLPVAHAMSRAGAVALLGRRAVAHETGLGAAYASGVTKNQIALAIAAGCGIGVIGLGPVVVVAAAGTALVCALVGSAARRRIGGVTGDVLGAAEQLSEVVVLSVAAAFVGRGWLDVPWWRALLPS